MALVSVIVPARDAEATIGSTLAALAAQRFDGEAEVIVVDDGSRDATAEIARGHAGITVVSQPGGGPAAARNRGVAESRGDLLAFTDADCAPEPGWLAAGTRALERLALAQGRVVPAGPVGPYDRTIAVAAETGLYETANLLVRREALEQVGGFEEWLATDAAKPMAEDVWLGWRVRRAGLPTGFVADAVVRHAVFARTPREYVAERTRLRHFPALARRIPELREERFFGRLFLTRRSAAVDAALLGAGLAMARRDRRPLAAALPLVAMAGRDARTRGGGPAAVELAADVVAAAALLRGSVAARSPLL